MKNALPEVNLAQLLITRLATFGYTGFDEAAYLQCFEANELKRARNELGCQLKMIQLVGTEPEYAELLTPDGLRRVAAYANGLGPHHTQLLQNEPSGPKKTPLATWAAEAGLQLHPYTFRADELPAYVDSLEEWLETFMLEVGVQGVFCDHPDIAVRVRNTLASRNRPR